MFDRNERRQATEGSRSPVRWLIGLALISIALYISTGLLAERYVRNKLDGAAAEVGAVIDPNLPPEVVVDLFARNVRITRISLMPSADRSGASWRVQGRIDTVRVAGLSLPGLLFSERAVMDELQLSIAQARVTIVNDSLLEISSDQVKNGRKAWSIAIGSFAVAIRGATVITANGDTISTYGNGIEAKGRALHFVLGQEEFLASLSSEQLHLSADSITAAMRNGYTGSVHGGLFDQERRAIEISGTNIGPRRGLEGHSATLPYETDVVEARLDTLRIEGFDMNAAFAREVWSARSMTVASGKATVLRDKLLPDGNDPVQPLPSCLLRLLPLGSGVDTINIAGLDVEYRERGDRARGYARIPFSHIHAMITGAVHSPNDSSAMVINAHAIAFDTASVSLHLRMVVADSTDLFEMQAGIGPLPFSALNKATGPLIDMQATSGRVDSVIYRMAADDRHATGLVRMAYRGLKVASGGRKREQTGNRIETVLLNSLVRDGHRYKDGTAREGRFAFDRHRDRSVFNYLWSGLREGLKAELLPELLTR